MGKRAKKSGRGGIREQGADRIKLRFGEGQILEIAGRYGDVEVDGYGQREGGGNQYAL